MNSEQQNKADRLNRIAQRGPVYQRSEILRVFVKSLRLVLPVVALGIIGLLIMAQPPEEAMIMPAAGDEKRDEGQGSISRIETVSRNELLNPNFESVDQKKQPYRIRAQKAIQGEKDEDLIILEQPVASMDLNNGHVVGAQAKQGAYNQKTQRLFLQGDVVLTHDTGYDLNVPELHVDLDKGQVWSERNVSIQGPSADLKAQGMEGRSEQDVLIFKGPAQLTLKRAFQSSSLSDLKVQ